MLKPSSKSITPQHHHHVLSNSPLTNPEFNSDVIAPICSISHYYNLQSHIPPIATLLAYQTSYFSSSSSFSSKIFGPQINWLSDGNFLVLAYSDFNINDVGFKMNGNFLVKNVRVSGKNILSQSREMLKLQIEVLWKRNSVALLTAGGFLVYMSLWRVLFEFVDIVVGLSKTLAQYGLAVPLVSVSTFACDEKLGADISLATESEVHQCSIRVEEHRKPYSEHVKSSGSEQGVSELLMADECLMRTSAG